MSSMPLRTKEVVDHAGPSQQSEPLNLISPLPERDSTRSQSKSSLTAQVPMETRDAVVDGWTLPSNTSLTTESLNLQATHTSEETKNAKAKTLIITFQDSKTSPQETVVPLNKLPPKDPSPLPLMPPTGVFTVRHYFYIFFSRWCIQQLRYRC